MRNRAVAWCLLGVVFGGAALERPAAAEEPRYLLGYHRQRRPVKRTSLIVSSTFPLAVGLSLVAAGAALVASQPEGCTFAGRCNDFASPAYMGTILLGVGAPHVLVGAILLFVGLRTPAVPTPPVEPVLLTGAELDARIARGRRIAIGGGVATGLTLALVGIGAALSATATPTREWDGTTYVWNDHTDRRDAGGALIGVGAALFVPAAIVTTVGLARWSRARRVDRAHPWQWGTF